MNKTYSELQKYVSTYRNFILITNFVFIFESRDPSRDKMAKTLLKHILIIRLFLDQPISKFYTDSEFFIYF